MFLRSLVFINAFLINYVLNERTIIFKSTDSGLGSLIPLFEKSPKTKIFLKYDN